ncbi:MAG: DUF177 domain-containing protein [Acetobacteraceae bacterium]|nr:DUF177 domain-containing protein [Acetobacteraceae bacterium]
MNEMERLVAMDRIGTAGLEMTVQAEPGELAAIAARLLIPRVSRLRCAFRLKRLEASIIEAAGQLEADVTQTCVVTLEDFDQPLGEQFVVRFVPEGTESDDDDPDAPDEIGYPAGAIDLGEAAVQQLALALPPYPRKPGLPETQESEPETPNPFAALAGLRRPQ